MGSTRTSRAGTAGAPAMMILGRPVTPANPPTARIRRFRRGKAISGSTAPGLRFRPWLDVMEGRTLLSTFVVNTTADSGPGSLRHAILDADALPGSDIINFDIPGDGVHTIEPTSELPPLTDSVLVDGWSQPG